MDLLNVEDLRARPLEKDQPVRAGVSFSLAAGRRLVLLCPPGAEASGLLRTIARVHPAAGGRVRFDGQDITRLGGGKLRALRRQLQYVGGDPMHSLPPRATASRAMIEGLQVHRQGSAAEQTARAEQMAAFLGLNPILLNRPVTSLSAGLRQRVALGRSLLLHPRLLITDQLVEHLAPAAGPPLLELLSRWCRLQNMAWLWASPSPELAQAYADTVLPLPAG